jgi:hypothetical protein
MPTLNSGETFIVRGNLDISGGTLTARDNQIARTKLLQEDLVAIGVPLSSLKVWDDLSANLPGTAAADDLAIIEGTWGTDAPTIQTSDAKAATVTQYARFEIPISDSYVLGQTIQIRIRAGMITTISDTSATVDLQVYVNDGDGAAGSDLCTTAAQSINSLTKADFDFTLTGTSLVRGDVLDCRVAIAITDSATGTAVIGEISKISLLQDIRG